MLKLHKAIYGLKQSPKCWHIKFESILKNFGLRATTADPCLFTGDYQDSSVLMIIYVDDGIVAANDKQVLDNLMGEIGRLLKLRLVETDYFIGFEIQRLDDGLRLHQDSYIQRMLRTYNMHDCCAV